jgi:hypothetical protein
MLGAPKKKPPCGGFEKSSEGRRWETSFERFDNVSCLPGPIFGGVVTATAQIVRCRTDFSHPLFGGFVAYFWVIKPKHRRPLSLGRQA